MALQLKNWLVKGLLENKFLLRFFKIDEELLRIGLQGILEHKLRSFLTMLGIIFGVAAVIAMLAIGEGARRQTLAQIKALGLNNIIVQSIDNEGKLSEEGNIKFTDLNALQKIVPTIDAVAPILQYELEVYYKTRSKSVELLGTTPTFFDLMGLRMAQGALFDEWDDQNYQKVCVLGNGVARDLFLTENPLGKLIKIGKVWFRIVGVLDYHPISTLGANEVDYNNKIYAPLQTVYVRFDRPYKDSRLQQMVIHVPDESKIVATAQFAESVLQRRHQDEKDFKMIVPELLLRQSAETQRLFNIVMGAIAGISLLVGGIGIMNIMLASVLERTREIGIRRSLGATRKDILGQFLLEAALLSLIGGMAGILVGYLLSYAVTFLSDWNTYVSWWSVLLSVGVSALVGILFGFFPARKAADLNPIDALRYE
ncbi:MAG: ABC transporter permease [Caldisericaceae bacterium]|nr:ABC transporter permease [Caldisericaceae bacterium]